MREEPGPAARFLNRPWVLLTLFALVVGVIVWVFVGPHGPDAEDELSPDVTSLRRAAARAKLMDFTSEAQRLYLRGLGQCREGDVVGARQTWGDLAVLFRDVEEERAWVQLAQKGLEMLKNVEQPAEARRAAVLTALQEIQKLREAGQADEAAARRQALLGLYRNDPAVRELLGECRIPNDE